MNKISVVGVGKLGLCWALELEKNGYDVLGVDINKNYVNSLNNKTFNFFTHKKPPVFCSSGDAMIPSSISFLICWSISSISFSFCFNICFLIYSTE